MNKIKQFNNTTMRDFAFVLLEILFFFALLGGAVFAGFIFGYNLDYDRLFEKKWSIKVRKVLKKDSSG